MITIKPNDKAVLHSWEMSKRFHTRYYGVAVGEDPYGERGGIRGVIKKDGGKIICKGSGRYIIFTRDLLEAEIMNITKPTQINLDDTLKEARRIVRLGKAAYLEIRLIELTPRTDLPLLIGEIKEPKALKLLEQRLRGK